MFSGDAKYNLLFLVASAMRNMARNLDVSEDGLSVRKMTILLGIAPLERCGRSLGPIHLELSVKLN